MAQGTVKSKSAKTSARTQKNTKSKSAITKKGGRTITPKKTSLKKQQAISKKLSASLITKTEKMLGDKVGHLEMLGGKDKKSAKGNKQETKRPR